MTPHLFDPKLISVAETKAERRTLRYLIGRLPPDERVRFLSWCCDRVPGSALLRPAVNPEMWAKARAALAGAEADERLANEVYLDLCRLGGEFGLDLTPAAVELEHRVRAHG